ncbi:MAG: hypothetical protein M1347_02910 [Chloroflexi bacterium]|nr:hypothetical protein [Chloroflexota bacterium]
MSQDPLDAFFDTPEKLEGEMRERLAQMIVPFAAADPVSGDIHPKRGWNALDTKKKVLVILLAKLALSAKDAQFSASISSKEIEQITGLPGGTVRPKLSELVKDRIAFRDHSSNYSVRPTPIAFSNAWALMESEIHQ